MSTLHARLLHLESKVTTGDRHLQDIRAAVVNTQNDTQIQSEGLKMRLSVVENLVEDLQTDKSVLEVRLNVSEKLLEELKIESRGQMTKLHNMELQLTHNTAALDVRLNVSEELLEELKTECTGACVGKFNISEQMMDDLKATTEGETKVAFAAALTNSGSVGPFDQETTLIFSKVFTNVGRAYDETSGVFTAPVGGVYVFSFTAADFLKGYMGVTLYRNQEPIISSLDLNDHGGYASATNGALIRLAAGDRVRLSLPASYRLYDDTRSFSVFSGFLLFPLEADQ
nr:complement C1q-like protein 2 [Nerophis lumbriciformis]